MLITALDNDKCNNLFKSIKFDFLGWPLAALCWVPVVPVVLPTNEVEGGL